MLKTIEIEIITQFKSKNIRFFIKIRKDIEILKNVKNIKN